MHDSQARRIASLRAEVQGNLRLDIFISMDIYKYMRLVNVE
jgi:tRNA threonylcarbamoyladenosine modification (KEOPS) complex  Pcc1 subunit